MKSFIIIVALGVIFLQLCRCEIASGDGEFMENIFHFNEFGNIKCEVKQKNKCRTTIFGFSEAR